MPTPLNLPTEIDLVHFISKEAHDLRSPFNRALGFMKLVIRGLDGPISDQAKGDLTTAYQNNQYALVLMNSLVEMARLHQGERKPTPGPCAVDQLLQQTLSDWKRQYPKEHPVEVTYRPSDLAVHVDEMMMRQGLANWISYTAEFIQEEAAVHIQVTEEPETCQFTIRSTGKKTLPPPECDLTMYGYIAREILSLNQGVLRRAEENEAGAVVQFTLPKA